MTGVGITLESATSEDFAPLVGQVFQLAMDEDSEVITELLLDSVELSAHSMPGGRTSFSLYFEGPADVVLEQQIYSLTNTETGTLGIFLVPVSGDAEHRRYQAVFN